MATPKKRRTKTPRTPTKPKAQHVSQEAAEGESTDAPSPSASAGFPSFDVDGLTYVLDKPPRKNGRRSVVSVKLTGSENAKPFVDRVDLFSFRSRHAFAGLVADSFGRQTGDVLGHLAVVLDEIERNEAKATKPVVPVLTPGRVKAAEKLLTAKNLLDKAAKTLDLLGYVGEERNKRLGYLVATSRLLTKPLSAILMAPSGSGKSELLDKLALLLPEESVEFLSRLTPAALYYLGPDHLRHKLVLVDEQAGASEADYPIRTLQSKGLLRLAATVKGKTEPFVVHGPIALMSGTTDQNLNPENLSRCLELSLDDSKEQTRLIQEAQRRAWAGEKRTVDTMPWQDAQRLLEPLEVVIPFATKLDYPTRTTKDRRDNAKLLTLIATHALLVQRQRKRDREGRLLATVEDYEIVYELLRPQVDAELDGLSARAATLYRTLLDGDRVPFTRREVADLLGWSYMTTKRTLDELVGNELVYVSDHEYVRSYALLEVSPLGNAASLKKPSEIKPR
jgi:DNA-binding MarR family transcriptional regulator